MPTLDGKLWNADVTGYTGSFRVTPSGLVTGDGAAVVGLPIVITCGTGEDAGLYSQAILPGDYVVQIPGLPQFSIQVPTGSGEDALEDVVTGDTNPLSYQRVFDEWADVQAVTLGLSVSIITLRADDNGALDISFFRDTDAAVLAFTPDGVNVVDDASDARFLRQGVRPADL